MDCPEMFPASPSGDPSAPEQDVEPPAADRAATDEAELDADRDCEIYQDELWGTADEAQRRLGAIDYSKHFSGEDLAVLEEVDRRFAALESMRADERAWEIVRIASECVPPVYRDLKLVVPRPPSAPGVGRPHPETPERAAPLERLLDRIKWRLHGDNRQTPEIRESLHRLATQLGVSYREAKRAVLRVGLVMALGQLNRPEEMRFGQRWLTDANGRQAQVPTSMLSYRLLWPRIHALAISKAEEWLATHTDSDIRTEDSFDRRLADQDADLVEALLEQTEPDLLDELIADESDAESRGGFERFLGRLTPAEYELVSVLREQDDPEDTRTAARTLGKNPESVRRVWLRLVGRMSGLSA